jgi:hypothetical protein
MVGSREDPVAAALGRWSTLHRASSLHSLWRQVAVLEQWSVMQLAAGVTLWAADLMP